MRALFYLPVYNQINELPKLLEDFKKIKLGADLLFVNNASNDGSEDCVRNSGYPYINLDQNRGVGYSNMMALDWAIERGYEVFGTMASNGKMLPAEMDRILHPILSNEADYVTGSRFLKDGNFPNLPAFRRYAIPMVNIFTKFLTGKILTDATCGYRAMRIEIVKTAAFDWHARWLETYEFEYYLYAKVILSNKWRWKEVPITMSYPKSGSYSKIKPLIGWWAMLKPWIIARYDGKFFR